MSMFVSLSISFLSFLWQFFFIKSGPIHGRLVCILVHIHPLTSHIPHAPCISLLMILTFSLFISQDANLWFSLFLQVTIILKLFMIERQILTTSHFWKLNPMKRFGRTAELLLQIGSRGPLSNVRITSFWFCVFSGFVLMGSAWVTYLGGATGQKFANYWDERADDFAKLVFQTLLEIETLGIFLFGVNIVNGVALQPHCRESGWSCVSAQDFGSWISLEVACQVFWWHSQGLMEYGYRPGSSRSTSRASPSAAESGIESIKTTAYRPSQDPAPGHVSSGKSFIHGVS